VSGIAVACEKATCHRSPNDSAGSQGSGPSSQVVVAYRPGLKTIGESGK
jgi:hypothetical protein